MTTGRAQRWGWAIGAVLCATALVRALTASGPAATQATLTPELERTVWNEVISEEASLRAKATSDFPSHRWSQEDAFGAYERSRVEQVANTHRLSQQAVFRIVDRGLREHWPLPDGAPPPHVTVVPFSPRPFD